MMRFALFLRSAPLWVRLGVPISLIVALAIGLVSFLNYYTYEKTYRQLNVSRITVVARDLRQAIETGLNVGLEPRTPAPLPRKAEQILVDKQSVGRLPIETLRRFALVVNMTTAIQLGIYPPLDLIRIAELL